MQELLKALKIAQYPTGLDYIVIAGDIAYESFEDYVWPFCALLETKIRKKLDGFDTRIWMFNWNDRGFEFSYTDYFSFEMTMRATAAANETANADTARIFAHLKGFIGEGA